VAGALSADETVLAAQELFAERGYAGVGLDEVAARAGVSRTALERRYPGGKDELFGAVAVRLSAETAKRVRAGSSAGRTPLAALERGIDAFLDASMEPAVRRVLLLDGPAVLGREVWQAIDSEYGLVLLDGALARAIEAGELPPQPTRAAARVLLGALEEAAMTIAGATDVTAARTEMGGTVHRLLLGLRAPLR
jgi:AcrR family transcriptional regulator